ncbi:CPBP family intramembrane glutamic endopeptidase [Alteriqipengyuania sp. 357]
MNGNDLSPDFPYYQGAPVWISGKEWLVPLAAVALAACILLARLPVFSQGSWQAVPSLLLVILPLAGLALVAGKHWTALFRHVAWKDIGWMVGFALLNYSIAIPLGLAAVNFVEAERNAGIASLAAGDAGFQILFFASSIPQLVGEELISIIPFLALLYLLTQKLSFSRRTAIIAAWLITAVWFAAIHLPTYNWNILQCLIVIGSARIVLTLAYLKTKNLWVSAGAHIINDWTTFAIVLVGTR